MNKQGLGAYVGERRKALSLTQGDLAKTLGYTTQGISKFEAGESQISILVLPKLANLLNESLDELLSQAKAPAPLKEPNPQFDNANLVANLIALRSQHNLSQEKEAEILGVSKRSIINYEQGESYPAIDTLQKLLAYYHISAKSFYFEKISPLPLAAVHYRDPHKKGRPFWIALLCLAGVGLIVGCTSPLWSGYLHGEKALASATSAPTSATSAPTSASATATSESTSLPSSIPVSTSSTSSTTSSGTPVNDDLSPYLPGLKTLTMETSDGVFGSIFMNPGRHTLKADSGAFVFDGNNYALEFSLSNTDFGASLEPIADPYGEVTLVLADTASDSMGFSVNVKAYATAHPEAPVEGAYLTVHIWNPTTASTDLSEDFPGLKAVHLNVRGAEDDDGVRPGSYHLETLTTPADYLSANGIEVSYGLLTPHKGITITEDVLTVPTYVSNLLESNIRLTLVKGTASYVDENGKIRVDNPSGEPNSETYPGLLSMDITYQGSHVGTLSPGDALLKVAYTKSDRFSTLLDADHFCFSAFTPAGSINLFHIEITDPVQDLSSFIIKIPNSLKDQTLLTINFFLLAINGDFSGGIWDQFEAAQSLYFTISNPSASSASA
jgi:transcriptional regulator with XRE-family HTH domain